MLAVVVAMSLFQSGLVSGPSTNGSRPTPGPRSATAIRSAKPLVLDGKDDDEVWRGATPITSFQEFDPIQGKEPRFRTEAKVAYDGRNLYVFVRMYDPEPEKILRQLARRDIRTDTDQIKVILDPYHDRRSGYEFAVNPAGVKRDFAIYNDGQEDDAWDGVWDAATTIDALGWTAEFRIPLSQLRYNAAQSQSFGFGVWRDIERFKERVSWPLYRRDAPGLVSQLGEVVGFVDLPSPRRLEVRPYAVTKNTTLPSGTGYNHPQQLTGGLDFKYGVSSNLTLDGTVNPDFGQVEADPAVLNLSAFETFFQERRPFFIEGNGLLSFPINCYIVRDCGSENLFYSRRIGRAPQLTDAYGDASSPTGTTILGATKLTGRTASGLSVGALEAVTGREEGTLGRTIEPRSNYSVFRATQDLRRGETVLGVMGTLVNRSNDRWTDSSLRSGALVGGVDFRHRFLGSRYLVVGRLVGSRVTGSPEAIAATQTDAVHYYQRPDGALHYNPTRTSLSGDAEEVTFGKVGGGQFRFETSYQRVSPGFEPNDLGFLQRGDWQALAAWESIQFSKPGPFFRQLYWNFNQWSEATTAGLATDRGMNTNVHLNLPNNFWVHLGGTFAGLGTNFCDRCARGGPALRVDHAQSMWGGFQADTRWAVTPALWFNTWRADGGRTSSWGISPAVDLRVSTRWTGSFGIDYRRSRDDRQWYGNYLDGSKASHYTFGHLEQRTTSLTARVNYTASPTLTVQVYTQPFVSKGQYTDIRELNNPRAASYTDRFKPYADTSVTNNPAAFNYKQFRSNLVVRWEYRAGSALFLVWQQGRLDSESIYGNRSFGADLNQLWQAHPDNTLLIKLSYWFDR